MMEFRLGQNPIYAHFHPQPTTTIPGVEWKSRETPQLPAQWACETRVTARSCMVLLVGASVRAAAFSALRAQLQPLCADLFADADLKARCPVVRIAAGNYPAAIAAISAAVAPGPWIYTGGLENYRGLIRKVAARHSLWGNGPAELRKARAPHSVYELLD